MNFNQLGSMYFLGATSQKGRPPVGNQEGTGTHRAIPGIPTTILIIGHHIKPIYLSLPHIIILW